MPFRSLAMLRAFVAACCLAVFGLTAGGGQSLPAQPGSNAGKRDETIAFVNVNVVPMTSEAVLPTRAVLVGGGRIVAIGRPDELSLPRATRTIDAKGLYLVPGLIDFHVHLRSETELDAYIRHGVTTVAAMRGTETVLLLRKAVMSGEMAGPRILTSGPLIDGDPPIWPGSGTVTVTTETGARAAVEAHCRGDYEFVKVYNNLHANLLSEIVSRAHGCGMPVAGHLPRLPVREEGLRRAIAAGIDIIAHGEEVFFTQLGGASDVLIQRSNAAVSEEVIDAAVAMIRSSGAYVVPTLSFIAMTARMLEDLDAVLAGPEFERLSPEVQNMWREQNPTRRRDLQAFERRERVKRATVAALTFKLQKAGVPLLLGTDSSAPGMFPGKSAHVELEELVASGLTPFEALATATRNPGRFFSRDLPARLKRAPREGLRLHVGTIEPGASADLLVVRGNPLEDIRNLARLEGVMVRGRWRPASTR